MKPVDGLFAVTVAPGIAAPCWSTTRPVMVPVVCCANADAQASSINTAAPNKYLLIPTPPICSKERCPAQDTGVQRAGGCKRNTTAYALRTQTATPAT